MLHCTELSFCFEISTTTEKAIASWKAILKKSPFSKADVFNTSNCLQPTLNFFEKAIEAYDIAIAIDETFASAILTRQTVMPTQTTIPGAIETYLEQFL